MEHQNVKIIKENISIQKGIIPEKVLEVKKKKSEWGMHTDRELTSMVKWHKKSLTFKIVDIMALNVLPSIVTKQ